MNNITIIRIKNISLNVTNRCEILLESTGDTGSEEWETIIHLTD